MPSTALRHFEEDIGRAKAIYTHARTRPHGRPSTARLRDDLLRSAWMFSVGAFDAYFCDAYADLLARTLLAKNRQHDVKLTPAISAIDLPVGAIFSPSRVRANWKWRLAARGLMEKDNVLSISKIQSLLNSFFSKPNRLFRRNVIDALIINHRAPVRLVGITSTNYRPLSGNALKTARTAAREKLVNRFNEICQRRHECIHNCDRPKQALLGISEQATDKAIKDIELLIKFCDAHIESQFNNYLINIGANGVTRNSVAY